MLAKIIACILTPVSRLSMLVAFVTFTGSATICGQVEPNEVEDSLEQELLWLRAEAVTVTTASLVEESVTLAPGTVVVITKRQIWERGYLTLRNLMNDLPGVDVQNYFEALNYNRIAIRGITGNHRFLILQDGTPINPIVGTPSQPVADNYPLYNAKQVEVVYGPTSALYGANAFSGIVNIITEKPRDLNGLVVAAEIRQFGYRRFHVYGGKQITDTISLSLGGHYHDSNNPDLSVYFPKLYKLNDLIRFDGTLTVKAEDRAGYRGDTRSLSTYARLDVGNELTFGWNQSYFQAPSSTSTIADHERYGAKADVITILARTYGKYRFRLGERLKGEIQSNYALYELHPDSKFANTFSEYVDAFK